MDAKQILTQVGLVLLGVLLAVIVFCAVVCIASSVNGLTFGNQIANWFTTSSEAIEESAEVAEAVASVL